MTEEQAKNKKPCYLCIHFERCKIVDYVYSPCYETDKNGQDYHGAFEINKEAISK